MDVQFNKDPVGDPKYPRQQATQQYTQQQPVNPPAQENQASSGKKKLNSKFLTLVLVLVVIVSGVAGGLMYYQNMDKGKTPDVLGATSEVDSNAWSSVFLINGQVYFGKIVAKTEAELVLDDVYFLRVIQNPVQATQAQALAEGEEGEEGEEVPPTTQQQVQQQYSPELTIVSRDRTLHNPTGKMTFNMQNVLFVEQLSPESKVIEAINTLKQQQATEGQQQQTEGE
ncbi:hypothetical protein GF362_05525 [Candidatus Dojkabacteria bacterium]|nr:hypothetical protein [Candidatus Dojkabacteria bacterium]